MGTKNYNNYSDMITFTRASTGTYLDSDGVLKSATTNTPRVEYDYQGNRLGLLVEEARTNLFNYSNNPLLVDGGGVNSTTIGANTQADPAGTSTASLITATTVGGFFGPRYVSGAIGAVYTAWFIVKNSNSTRSRIYVRNSGDAADVTLNWSGATLSSTTDTLGASTVESLGGDYYKVAVTYTATEVIQRARFYPDNLDGNKSVILYAWQLEQGTFPTSYIPTAGATATRSADVASIGVGAFGYNKTAGSVLVEATYNADPTLSSYIVEFSDGTAQNNHFLFCNGSPITARVTTSGTLEANLQVTGATPVSQGHNFKASYALSEDNFNLAIDGSLAAGDTSVSVPTVNNLFVGSRLGSGYMFTGHISSIAYYPRRLTDAQIKALTSPPETPTLSLAFDDSSTSYLETSIHG
jgi:hypothetical protein